MLLKFNDLFIKNDGVLLQYIPPPEPELIFTTEVDISKISGTTFTLGLIEPTLLNPYNYNFIVDWGDGVQKMVTAWNSPGKTHTYSANDIYTIKIWGTCEALSFSGTGIRASVLNISEWGCLGLKFISFENCTNLTSIANPGIHLINVTSFQTTFRNSGLTSIDFSGADFSNCTNFSGIFRDCSSLISADISGMNVSSSTTFSSFFQDCNNLTTVNISNWIYPSGNFSLGAFFIGCSSLVFSNLTGIDTFVKSNTTNISSFFGQCTSLSGTINVSNWDVTNNCTAINSVFTGCTNIEIVNLTGWDVTGWTSTTTNLNLFNACSSLTEIIGIENLNWSNARRFDNFFNGCSSLVTIDISLWNTSNILSFASMFQNCASLNTITGIEDLDVSSATNISRMFQNIGLTSLDLSNWITAEVTNIQLTFANNSFTSLNLTGWNTNKVTNMQDTFSFITTLETITGISLWSTSALQNLQGTFRNSTSLTSLDLSNWDTSNVTLFTSTAGVTPLNGTFYLCSSLTSLNLTGWVSTSTSTLRGLFRNCSSLTSISGVNGLITGNITVLEWLFSNCGFTTLDLSTSNTSNVTNFNSIFRVSTSLTTLNLSGWNIESGTNFNNFLTDVPLNTTSYDNILINFGGQTPITERTFDANLCKYTSAAESARNTLINDYDWIINDDGLAL